MSEGRTPRCYIASAVDLLFPVGSMQSSQLESRAESLSECPTPDMTSHGPAARVACLLQLDVFNLPASCNEYILDIVEWTAISQSLNTSVIRSINPSV